MVCEVAVRTDRLPRVVDANVVVKHRHGFLGVELSSEEWIVDCLNGGGERTPVIGVVAYACQAVHFTKTLISFEGVRINTNIVAVECHSIIFKLNVVVSQVRPQFRGGRVDNEVKWKAYIVEIVGLEDVLTCIGSIQHHVLVSKTNSENRVQNASIVVLHDFVDNSAAVFYVVSTSTR